MKTKLREYFENAAGGPFIFPLVVLFLIYFFDEFDTAAFGTLAPEIQRSFHMTDAKFAVVVLLNLTIVLLAAVPVGYAGDRLPRRTLVVVGGIVAGVFSFATGLVTTVGLLLLVRVFNGFGLLVNDPIHTSLLTDYYEPDKRANVFATHRNAARVGAVVGPAIAGLVAWQIGWRASFLILIVPILAASLYATKLRNPVRGGTDNAEAALVADEEQPVPFARGARMLFAVKTLRRQYLAWCFIGAGLLPLAFLAPLYFDRVYGVGVLGRGAITAAGALAAYFGIREGGKRTPGLMAKGMGEPLKLAGWSLVAVGPAILLVAIAPFMWFALVANLTANYIGGYFTAPFVATQALVSPARVRSLSFSFGSTFLVLGTWVLWAVPFIGVADNHGMRWALGVLVPYWVIGGLIVRSSGQFVEADTKRAFEILATTAELRRARLDASASSILVCKGVNVSYGPVQVLFDVDFEMKEGEIVALLGTNGAGKSTLLRAISGLVSPGSGAIFFDGEDVTGLEPEESFQHGLVQVPGGRGIFPGLTVKENFDVAVWAGRRPKAEANAAVEEVLDIFPSLRKRWDQKAAVLSGGEAQMLTLGQALIAKPKLLMIDELSLGLAPVVVEELLKIVRRINADGTAVILVEQSVNVALTVAERACFMEKGEIRYTGPTSELLDRPDILRSVFLSGASAMEGVK
ncbi:MAG: branched-chain amino acid transport system ATP-binding protein livF [Actinomycetota bacterium]